MDTTREAELELALEEANAKLGEQDELLARLTAPPFSQGTVLQTGVERTFIATGQGKVSQVETPPVENKEDALQIGDQVAVSPMTGQIIEKSCIRRDFGRVAVIEAIDELTQTAEIGVGEARAKILWDPEQFALDRGDRVVLDLTGYVALANLGRENEGFKLSHATGISWDDIGGLEGPKAHMREALILPQQHPEIYTHYQKSPLKGLLLDGPPGCGKTMLGKAAATELAKIYGEEGATEGFIYIKGPEILDRWVGVAEQTIRALFARARDFKAEHGYPAVIFLDEADAILSKRGSGVSSDMEKTIVPMFLAEMDGLDDNGALVILATNRGDKLDPAVIRDGRIDRKIRVPRPDRDTARQIFEVHLKDIPTEGPREELVDFGVEELYSPEHPLYELELKDGSKLPVTVGNFSSGAMIAGIIDQATSVALHRDIESGELTGIHKGDIEHAIQQQREAARHTNHEDDLKAVTDQFQGQIKKTTRLVA